MVTMLLIATFLAILAFARPYLQRRIRHRPWFTYSCAPLTNVAYAELGARSGWSKTSLRVSETVTLNGLVRRPLSREAPWLVFFPGNDANQLAGGQQFLDRVRAGNDWGLVVYAMRGYDSSGGRPNPHACASDGAKIIESVLQHEQVKVARLHVVAFSLGGYVAASAVGEMARGHGKLASLSLLSSICEAEMVHSAIFARITLGEVYDILPLLDAVPAPVLVLHGGADHVIEVEQGKSIAARLAERAQFRIIPGAEHSLIENETAITAVRDMVEVTSRH